MKKFSPILVPALLFGIASIFLSSPSTARLAGVPSPPNEPSILIRPTARWQDQFPRDKVSKEAFGNLMAQAQSEGAARVIVGLRVDAFEPEGELALSETIAQRDRIARAQDSLRVRMSPLNPIDIRNFKFIPFAAMTVNAAALAYLMSSDDVTSIEEDLAVPPTLAQSVPLVGAPTAWAAGYAGSGQAVAILDTGVDKTHSFLSGKVVSEACYSSNTSNASSVCPGGVSSSTSSGSGVNCSLTIEGCDHGTHVAGIAAGKGSSFSGVAKEASIIAVQVFSRFDGATDCKDTEPCALSYTSDQVRGLERVYALRSSFNIAAVNMSLGGGRFFSNCDSNNPSLKAAIDNLRSANIATVISSGNSGHKDSMGSPACISTAVSVGATGDGSGSVAVDSVAGFSNSASFLSLLAPGNLINSSVPGGSFSNFQGTSMAAPHVTGAWAVLKSKKPTATVDEVFIALRDTGLPITDTNGITKPRIKVDAAINAIGGGSGCATTPIALGQTINGSLTATDCRYPLGSSWYADAYSFNGTAGQQVAISMSSGSFDTWVALVSPTGTELTFDNDGGGGTNSRIPAGTGFFTLPSTGTFVIQASSNPTNAEGAYTISLTAPPSAVGNDNFANAQLVSGSSGSTSGTNTGATKEAGEPNHAGNFGGASIWFRWQAPANAMVTMTTVGSNFDTLLGIYTGSTVGGLTLIASNDDEAFPSSLNSRVTFTAVAGTTYRIAVDGFNGATGNVFFNWSSGPTGPANDNFAGAQIISGSSGTVTGNNVNATKETGEPSHAGNSGGVSVWYRWTAPSTGTVTFVTAGSNFDTLLAAYTGASVGGLTLIASNDDANATLQSVITFNASNGVTYYLAVDGYNGAAGSIVFGWSQTPSAPTANPATNVTTNSFTANWSGSTGATGYRLDVSTSNTFSSFVSGYNNLDVGNVTNRSVTGLSANTTYFYRVRAYNSAGTSGNSGTVTVTTSTNPPSAPTAGAGSNITYNSFTANWNNSSGATGYRLDVSTSSSFISFLSGYQNLDVGNVLNRSITGLTSSTLYYYRVRAYNAGGISANSNTITVSTLGPMIFIEQGTSNRAAALDSIMWLKGPFKILNFINFTADKHTRVMLFTSDLGMSQPDSSQLTVRAGGVALTVESVGPVTGVTGMNASYIIVRLPDGLPAGDLPLVVTLRGLASSNSPTLSISP